MTYASIVLDAVGAVSAPTIGGARWARSTSTKAASEQSAVGVVRAADEDPGAGVAEHEREPFLWIARVERDVRAAGLQDPERPDHELG